RSRRCSRIEGLPALHPLVSALEHLARVWLEHDALAWTEAPHVDEPLKVFRHLPQPVMLVAVGLEIDLALGVAQCAEVALQILVRSVLGDEEAHDESRVEELAQSQLLEDVVLSAKHIRCLDLAAQHQPHSIERPPYEVESDLCARQEWLEPLNRGVMAAGVVAHADLHARELLVPAVRRVRRY